MWDGLGGGSGTALLPLTGGVYLGRPDSPTVAGSLRAAREWNLPHELLDATEIRRRFPRLSPDDDEVALYETAAGFVRPELTVSAHLTLAGRPGAELHFYDPGR